MAKILVVDDDATYRTLTKRALEQMGYNVETAKDGVEALRRTADFTFDLIVTDIFMPDMDGLEFIRTVADINDTPILAISGGGSRVSIDFLRHAGTLGADAMLHKPVAVGDLRNAVESLLRVK